MLLNRSRRGERLELRRVAVALAVMLLAAACSDERPDASDGVVQAPTTTEAVGASSEGAAAATGDDLAALPVRDGPREETTYGVPHVQVYAEPVPEVDAELRRRVYAIPGVEERESGRSVAGARSLWLADDVELARPDVLDAGREIGHIHPNGSLHVVLPVERAVEVAETKWGELHPWVGTDGMWDGYVMLYTPETLDELDVTVRLVVDAYNLVTGANLDPTTIE